jgi:hypothetical protein
MRKISLLFFALILCANFYAQKNESETDVIVASGFQITRPLAELAAEQESLQMDNIQKQESSDKENRKPQKFKLTAEDGPEFGNDPNSIQKEMGEVKASQLKANWAGQNGPYRPNDPTGAVGPNHYVQMVNSTTMKVYNKTTGVGMLTLSSLGSLWNPDTANDGDPIVMYDKPADRWFLAQFGQNGNTNYVYIAISTTSDPTGSYYTYTFTSAQFPDYLKFSVWHDGYYMTANTNNQRVYCFERDAMLLGTPGARSVSSTFSPPEGGGFFIPLTGDAADGAMPPAGTPCPIFSYSDNGWGNGFVDRVNIYKMTVNWVPVTPTASITSVVNLNTAAFDASYNNNWDDVSQPGTTQKLDGIGGVFMYRAQWKTWDGYNTVVLNWGVKISSSKRAIKWCELRQNQNTGIWSIYQEGIYDPDAATRWMGAILMDDNGGIGLSYMKSDATNIYPGLYYTGRRACDPLGTMPIAEVMVVAGTGSQNDNNRNGDYAQATLDPDGLTIWVTSEYMGGATGADAARTRIFSYLIESCFVSVGLDIAITNGVNPMCEGDAITFTATPSNGGTIPSYQWQVDGVNVGSNSPTFTSSTLTADQVITCIVTSDLGNAINNPATSNGITILSIGTPVPTVSIALTGGNNPTCAGLPVTFTATPSSGGTNPNYQWTVDGVNVGTNSPTFTSTEITDGQSVSCTMTSSLTCAVDNLAVGNSVMITVTPSVAPAVTIAISGGTNPSAFGDNVTFMATPQNGGASPSYQWYVDGTPVGTNTSIFSSTTLSDGQIVSCVMTSNGSCVVPLIDTSNGITMGITGELVFCGGSSINNTDEYISTVASGTINNPSGATTYSNFTALSRNVYAGSSFSVTVSIGSGFSTDKIYIWCDWNQNGIFTDAGENVYTSPNGIGPFTTTIIPPSNAENGNTRMRIRLTDTANGTSSDPCGTSSYGEVEDYTLIVAGGVPISVEEVLNANGISSEEFVVYPNPGNGTCTVKSVHSGTFYLMNTAGQLVKSFTLNADNKYTIQLENLASGVYIVSGQNKYGIVKQKIVVTK